MKTQEVDIQKQIDVYKEQTKLKKQEEEQLSKVVKDYRERFGEFDKSIKQSRKTVQSYEKEINAMNRTIQQLGDTKKRALKLASGEVKKKGKGKQPKDDKTDAERSAELDGTIASIKTSWFAQKAALMAEKDLLQGRCTELQAKIKDKQ